MLKKNSWIIALLLALSLTAFIIIGCVPPVEVEEDNEVYEEYPLDKGYNAWAGQVYQKGWAIGGIKFQGKGDKLETAKDLGYDIDMFRNATKLKIEMPDASYPRSGVAIIWGGEDESGDSGKAGGMWNQQEIAGGSGDVDTTFAKKDGNVLIIDLTRALKNYPAYTKAAKLKIVMQVNAPSYGDVEGLVQKAFLMIPATPPPFKSVGNMSLVRNYMYYTSPGFEIEAKILPSDATNQTVNWAIVGWGPTGSVNPTIELPKLDPFDSDSVSAYNAKKAALLEKIGWLQEEYVFDDTVYPAEKRLRDVPGIFIVPKASGAASIGKVFVQATIKNAIEELGKTENFTGKFSFEIRDPLPLTFKFIKKTDGTLDTTMGTAGTQTTKEWGAIDNGGVKGGYMEVLNNTPVDSGPYTKYTITLGGGYGNSHHYFKVDLGSKKLSELAGIKAHYKAGDGDSNLIGKTIRLRGSTTVPSRTYSQAGPYVATLAFPGGADVKDTELEFEFFIDKGNVFDADKTGEKPMPSPNQTINGETVPFQVVKDAKIVYLWFVPWSEAKKDGKATTFEISDIRLITNN
jgi:hypothetical protein